MLPTRERYDRASVESKEVLFSGQISITSQTGVGKSATVEVLKKKLPSYDFISVGSLMRKRQKDMGFATIEDFAGHSNLHPEEGHDEWCDAQIYSIAAHRNYIIGEGRLVHVFMPYAFHVLLTCELYIRSSRRWKDQRKRNPKVKFEKTLQDIVMRDVNDAERYEGLYPGCMWLPEHFDIVISTEFNNPHEVADMILNAHHKWLSKAMNQPEVVCMHVLK